MILLTCPSVLKASQSLISSWYKDQILMRRKSNESKECSTYPKDILAPWGLKSFWNKMLKCEAYTLLLSFTLPQWLTASCTSCFQTARTKLLLWVLTFSLFSSTALSLTAFSAVLQKLESWCFFVSAMYECYAISGNTFRKIIHLWVDCEKVQA